MIVIIMTKKNKNAVYRHYIYYSFVCSQTLPACPSEHQLFLDENVGMSKCGGAATIPSKTSVLPSK
jgi:hypothetical protein